MAERIEYPELRVPTAAAWEAWLREHHGDARGVWLHLAKKAAAEAAPSYTAALEVALCYGWIDGQARGGDARTYTQKFTPRGPRSLWSKRNREKAVRLIAEGRMQPAGLAAVEAARADGRWDAAYDSAATATVPEDLARALAANPQAQARFAALSSANRYAVLFRIQTAVRPQTRAARIARLVAMLAAGETIHPQAGR
ncbi:MAG TPA: YdeI/OmpD-associated family protein [Dehalococcoidia bacterium]|nr:YdeI/OmpD-associated family protein [Dehalococcoidia bacterium]